MIIGILSDTHDLLRPEVTETLRGCDYILHAGDISRPGILEELDKIAPVTAVRGNNDWGEWAENLPLRLDLALGGLRICMAHRKWDLPEELSRYDLAVYGHSHEYACEWLESEGKRTLLLNPGSCGIARFGKDVTIALLHVKADGFHAERIDLSRIPKRVRRKDTGDLKKQIETVMKETEKGRSVDAIAERYGIDRALAERIARLYVTHPGVTADGIMAKMGL